ncbi:MAG: class I SAM-dependent methyltransferase [Thiobacillus sp.]
MKKYLYEINVAGEDAPAKILRAVGNDKRVLEIGCASGTQSRVMKEQQRCVVTGIEIDADAALYAKQYCENVIVGDLESLDLDRALGNQRYDVVTIADVLEHLRQPARVLVQLKRYLNEDGFIVASIPNVVHAGLILEMANGRFDYRPYGLLDDTHLRFFTLKTVYELFENCGLEIIELDRVIRPIEKSEFYTHPLSPSEGLLLDHIREHNSEWQTYQFIVKAIPAARKYPVSMHANLVALDNLQNLQLENQSLIHQVRSLQGRIAWIESRPAYKFYSVLKRIFKK